MSCDTTSLGRRFDGWEEAVTCAGGLLEEAGCIRRSYTRRMVEMVKELGPYIVITPGVALAHARPEGDVEKNSISLVTVEGGVNFGNTSNDPVYAVFAVAARSDQEHLVLFKELAQFIGEEEKLNSLEHAASFEEIQF